ncbi:MAG: RnfABCDGE type electron transport complex subunit B [Candidatus Woesearchaeota archaeon]
MTILFYSILILGGMGILFGIILAIASQKLAVKVNPKVWEIERALPGLNCGACGYPSCAAYAKAVFEGEKTNLCKPGREKTASRISQISGRSFDNNSNHNTVAQVRCNGGCNETTIKFEYKGIKNCRAASLVNDGYKNCNYSCLGFGDCVKVCPVDAIKMSDNHLPIISKEICIGCGKCVTECPKGIIRLTPKKSRVHVRCSSINKGKLVVQFCKVGCIGCKKCEVECPFDAIHIKDDLAMIDYTKCTSCQKCVKVCPRKIITVDQLQHI